MSGQDDWKGESLIRTAPKRKVKTPSVVHDAAAIEARRTEVLRLVEAGLWQGEIARRVGVTPAVIHEDCRVLGVHPIVYRDVPESRRRGLRIGEV